MIASRYRRFRQLLKYFGPQWLMYRAWYAARLKSGLVRFQSPASTWESQPLSRFLNNKLLANPDQYADYRKESAPRFFFDPNAAAAFRSEFRRWDSEMTDPVAMANEIHTGFFRFFSHELVHVGWPPRWNQDSLTGHEFPNDRHWSQIGDFEAGDIKLVWEINRFAFVFPLVRSYWRTGNEQHAERFWQFVESWHESNPPETGPNWKCGQEISLRVMAWCFGLYGFGSSPASTPKRISLLAQAIAVSGRRIETNIGYALSQRNNHGLSEAMGLWTIGVLFPEFVDAPRWEALGRKLLEKQAKELIYDDGSFSQHSLNYHRVMLHDYLWSIRLGDVLNKPFSESLRDRIALASEFVYQLQEESTGRVPCYGQDDGALILPLSNCDYRDFRPVVQATHFLATGERRLGPGPWDEDLFWLFGETARATPSNKNPIASAPSRRDFEAPDGGYQTIRSMSGFAVTRAAKFRHRPAQADMLHVDIWWRGENVAIDPGTYSYNSPAPWNNPFAHTSHHNTVEIDGLDQMDRAKRFMWLPWLTGCSFGTSVPTQGDVSCWNGEHDGYRRLADPITHRRGLVRLGADHWLIVDSLRGKQPHSFRLHWLLLDAPFVVDTKQCSLELQTSAGSYRLAANAAASTTLFDIVRADPNSARGWRSPYYHTREPALSVCVEAKGSSVVFATILGPEAPTLLIETRRVTVQTADWNATVELSDLERVGHPLIESVVASGSLADPKRPFVRQPFLPLSEPAPCTFC